MCVGWQQTNCESRYGHQQYGDTENSLAANEIAEDGQNDSAKWTDQIACCKNGQSLQLRNPQRQVGWKKQTADDRCEVNENDELIKFEYVAGGRQRDDLDLLATE